MRNRYRTLPGNGIQMIILLIFLRRTFFRSFFVENNETKLKENRQENKLQFLFKFSMMKRPGSGSALKSVEARNTLCLSSYVGR